MAETLTVSSVHVNLQECPVCHEDYVDPKILPCTHLLCQKCVLSWLETKGNQAGCPLCHRSILSYTEEGQGDFSASVDALPTDYAMKIKIESQKTLNALNVCNVCEGDSVAVSFCLQCDTKLCRSCSKVHHNLPCSSDHVVEELFSLTAEQLAAKRQFPCNTHQEKAVELYCSSHEELICFPCAASTHRKCAGVDEIAGSATTLRQEMEDQNKRLRQKEASLMAEIEHLDTEVADAKAKFGDMRTEINHRFAELQEVLEGRQRKLVDDVQEKEEGFLTKKKSTRAKLDKLRSTLAAHADSVNTMLVSAPDKPLLATLPKLKSRLKDLESQKALSPDDDPKVTVGEVCFDEKVIKGLKKTLEITGELRLRDSPMELDKNDLPWYPACNAVSVTEGTFQFVVRDVGNLEQTVSSQCCIIRNIPWKIRAGPQTDSEDNKKYLGFYLACDLSSDLLLWSCDVEATLRILKTTSGNTHRTFRRGFGGLASEEEKNGFNWGWNEFISMDELLDPENKFVKDGQVTLEIHVVADAPKGVW